MAHLECTGCGLVLRPRGLSAAPRHCPRCIARRRALVDLTLVADAAELAVVGTSGGPSEKPAGGRFRRLRAIRPSAPVRRAIARSEVHSDFEGRLTPGDDDTRVSLFGELDIGSAPAAERLLREAEADASASIVIDLRGLRFIDSSGLRVILVAASRLGERLTLLPGPPPIQRTFERAGTARILPFAR